MSSPPWSQSQLCDLKSYPFHYCIPARPNFQCGPSWLRSSWPLVSCSSAGPAGGSSCRWRSCWGCQQVTGTFLPLRAVCPSAAPGSLPGRAAPAPARWLHSHSLSLRPGPPPPESLQSAPASPGDEEGKDCWCVGGCPGRLLDKSQCKKFGSKVLNISVQSGKFNILWWKDFDHLCFLVVLLKVTVMTVKAFSRTNKKTASPHNSESPIHLPCMYCELLAEIETNRQREKKLIWQKKKFQSQNWIEPKSPSAKPL